MFYVGQRVVCVDDSIESMDAYTPWRVENRDLDGLTKNRVYTVRELKWLDKYKITTVLLREIVRPTTGSVCAQYGEIGYHPARFRPLDERQTDITIFQEIVRKVQNNEPVEVG